MSLPFPVARRRFLGGAAAAWLAGVSGAFAQGQGKVRRIGYLMPRAAPSSLDEAFVDGLRELGYVVGGSVVFEFRWAGNDAGRLRALADELVRAGVDVIVTATTAGTRAAMQATRTVPIVMAASADPVAAGLIASLARPGGNVTGMSLQTIDFARKRLQQLREIVPGVTRVALLAQRVADASQGTTGLLVTETRSAASRMGIGVVVREIASADELVDAFAHFRRELAQALIVQVGSLALEHRARIVALAAQERLPAMYEVGTFAEEGGLVSYGPDLRDSYRRAAGYVDRILRGANPGDLPVQQPEKLALIINLKAAKALDLTLPPAVLMRADELIR